MHTELERLPPPPTEVPRARSLGPFAAAVLLVLVAVPVVLALIVALAHPGLPKGDFAVIEMRALDVPANLPLTGPYSRYGFNHPGPLLFYFIALPLRLFGPGGMELTAALVNLSAAVGLLVTLYRRGGQLLTVIGAGMVLLVIRALQIEVVSVWNPWVPILPMALAIALTWSVWSRDWWALPWLAGVVTFVVQTHVGFSVAGGFLLGSSLVWGVVELVRTRRAAAPDGADASEASDVSEAPDVSEASGSSGSGDSTGPRSPRVGAALAVSAIVLVVLWLPPLIDQLIHDPGNLSAILDFARSGQPGEQRVGLGSGIEVLSEVVGINGTLFNGISRFSLAPLQGTSVANLLVVLVPFLAGAGLAVWRRAYDALRLAVIVAVLVPIGWLSLAQISGPLFPYLAEWLVVLAAFLWLSAIWCTVSALWPEAASFSLVPRRSGFGRHLVPIVVSGLALVLLAGAAVAETVRSPGDGYLGGEVIEQFASPAADAAAGQGLVLITSPPTDLTNAAWALETSAIESGLQAELERRGLDVTTDNERAFLVGEDRVVGDRSVDVRLVLTADTSPTPEIDPSTSLATFDYLSPAERSEYQALDRKGGTDPPTPLVGNDLYRWGELRSRAVVYTLSLAGPEDG